jgi:capsular exopolysaccharide synthesis family protein
MTESPVARYVVLLRRWWWVVATAVLFAILVTAVTLPDQGAMTPEERASEATSFQATHLLIRNGEAPSQLTFELITLLTQQGELLTRIAERAGEDIGLTDVQAVMLTPDPLTDTISVTAVRPTPTEAAALATIYATELVAFLDERTRDTVENDYERITGRLEEIEASIDDLQDAIADADADDPQRPLLEADLTSLLDEFTQLRTQQRSLAEQREGTTASFVTLEEPSPVPVIDEGDDLLALPQRPALRFALAFIGGLLLGVAIVVGLDRFDTRIRTRRQAEEAFGIPVLAELPRRSRRHIAANGLPAYSDPGGVTAEVLRALRLSVALAPTWHLSSLTGDASGAVGGKTPIKPEYEPRTLVITSALTGDGKSTLAANLAVSIAEGGKRVLVVDCDFRRPAVGKLLDTEPGVGLRELTRLDERPLHDLATPTIAPNVAMVRSGSRGVTPSWFMAEAGLLVARCAQMADVVIFDTGPITLTNEASALLPHVDTGLVVVRAGKVDVEQARGAVEQLTQVDAHVSGVVLVASESRRRYGYGYYRADGEERPEDAGPRATSAGSGGLWNTNQRPSTGDDDVVPVPPAGGAESRHEPM